MRIASFCSLLLATSFGLISCQKEIGFDDPITNPGTGNTLTTYQPITAGSYWKYRDTATNAIQTMTATNAFKTFDGRSYNIQLRTPALGNSSDTAYYSNSAPNYYVYVQGQGQATGAPVQMLFHYLNDTAAVGSSWNYVAGQGNGFTASITTTILERNISVVVDTTTYTNVIHTKLNLSYNMMGMNMDMGEYHYYAAKNIGIVKLGSILSVNGIPFMAQTQELVEYHIQ